MTNVDKKALRALLFHWMTTHWTLEGFAEEVITLADVVSEMSELHMKGLIEHNLTTVQGAYHDVVEYAKDSIADIVEDDNW